MLAAIRCQKNANTILARKTAMNKSFDLFLILVKLATYFGGHTILNYCLFFLTSIVKVHFNEQVSITIHLSHYD